MEFKRQMCLVHTAELSKHPLIFIEKILTVTPRNIFDVRNQDFLNLLLEQRVEKLKL